MPFSPQLIKPKLQAIFDQKFSGFEGFPADSIQVASRWAGVVDFVGNLLIPKSLSTEAAKTAFVLTASTINYQNALPILSEAFSVYAVAIVPGMLPAFIGVPPVVPIDFAPVIPIGMAGGSSDTIAGMMASIIDSWFRTGTATPQGSSSVINWS